MSGIFLGIIGGSGLGESLGAERGNRREIDTPFGAPSGPILVTQWAGVDIAILQRHGPGHVHSPSRVPYRANLFALKRLGVTHVLASGACGSLRETIHPRDLVIVDQVIDKTHRRDSTFFDHAAVHVEFADPFCPVMRAWLLGAAAGLPEVKAHDRGTYLAMEGPAFSTRAESHMHRAWGADLIGMTAMPEAKLAREAELPYALIGLPTDYDCWKPPPPGADPHELLREIIGNLRESTRRCIGLIQAALSDIAPLIDRPSPAAHALRHAIWSDKKSIPHAEIERLRPIWGRYF
jgi:5'-methylthioadenosine phosphorylase